ncbi:MAG: hypothetical protein WC802_01465 [Patescibacteria group bacterium]|jgi:hypothetical protein
MGHEKESFFSPQEKAEVSHDVIPTSAESEAIQAEKAADAAKEAEMTASLRGEMHDIIPTSKENEAIKAQAAAERAERNAEIVGSLKGEIDAEMKEAA